MPSVMWPHLYGMHLDGISREEPAWDIRIPHAGSLESVLRIFTRNMADIAWHYLCILKNSPLTRTQAESILKGETASGIRADEAKQAKSYLDGAKKLIRLLKEGRFDLNAETACELHSAVAAGNAGSGAFRETNIPEKDAGYLPPDHGVLRHIAKNGFTFLRRLADTRTAAIAAFLFMTRTQFFSNANRRTASLMMNGYLMKHGFHPIALMDRDTAIFRGLLSDFIATGNAACLMEFFKKNTVPFLLPA